jgi:3-oxoacyl-[acyl-carrier protein] reductase
MVRPSGGQPEQRVAIVTGGSQGIGRETIHGLAGLGYAVVVNYVHDQRTAESTVEAVLAANGSAVAVRADVADDLDVERLFAETIEAFGGVDAVVHAVQGQISESPLAEIALDDFDALCRTTIRATFIVNRMAARRIRNGGAIVNVTGSVVPSVLPFYSAHAITAAAVEQLTRLLALELRDQDIRVNGVSIEVDKPWAPARVADVIAYLISDGDRYLTGQTLHVDDPAR